ncbi:hypothetical protein DFH29DRAFT_650162 [Suillus ampliporus]|nr:hypothetical protein DFH29DRAFT_650162 [Suillus ampliporus]
MQPVLSLQFVFVAVFAAVAVQASLFTCENKAIVSSSFIGKNSDVKVDSLVCLNTIQKRDLKAPRTNVCGDSCTTNCFTPSGGGPDPNDYQVIADALLYASQDTGAYVNISSGTVISMQYSTCETFFVNQATSNETYCRSDWAGVVGYVANNCQSQENAHGGNCIAPDQIWTIL